MREPIVRLLLCERTSKARVERCPTGHLSRSTPTVSLLHLFHPRAATPGKHWSWRNASKLPVNRPSVLKISHRTRHPRVSLRNRTHNQPHREQSRGFKNW